PLEEHFLLGIPAGTSLPVHHIDHCCYSRCHSIGCTRVSLDGAANNDDVAQLEQIVTSEFARQHEVAQVLSLRRRALRSWLDMRDPQEIGGNLLPTEGALPPLLARQDYLTQQRLLHPDGLLSSFIGHRHRVQASLRNC